MRTDPNQFILQNTSLMSPPHVPEVSLRLASEVHDLWQKTEEELETLGLPPPFWAFAWAGGQGLARHILNNPGLVRGKRVVDFASGSGIVAIAAKLAGADQVLAVDIDPWANVAIRLNADENGVKVDISGDNIVGSNVDADIVLAGDVFYDRSFTEILLPWFEKLRSYGRLVLVGDPGRAYCPQERLDALAVYEVPVTRLLEDSEVKKTTVWRFAR